MYNVRSRKYEVRNTELKISNAKFRFLNEEVGKHLITRIPYLVLCTSYLVQSS